MDLHILHHVQAMVDGSRWNPPSPANIEASVQALVLHLADTATTAKDVGSNKAATRPGDLGFTCATGVSHPKMDSNKPNIGHPWLLPSSHDALGLSSGARGEETVGQGMASALIGQMSVIQVALHIQHCGHLQRGLEHIIPWASTWKINHF